MGQRILRKCQSRTGSDPAPANMSRDHQDPVIDHTMLDHPSLETDHPSHGTTRAVIEAVDLDHHLLSRIDLVAGETVIEAARRIFFSTRKQRLNNSNLL